EAGTRSRSRSVRSQGARLRLTRLIALQAVQPVRPLTPATRITAVRVSIQRLRIMTARGEPATVPSTSRGRLKSLATITLGSTQTVTVSLATRQRRNTGLAGSARPNRMRRDSPVSADSDLEGE